MNEKRKIRTNRGRTVVKLPKTKLTTEDALMEVFQTLMKRNPKYTTVFKVYKNTCNDTVLLHVASLVLERLWVIIKSGKFTKMDWLTLIYLASTPAATKYEVRAYLEHFHGYEFGINGNKFNPQKLVAAGLAEYVKFPELNKGRAMLRITDKGKDTIRKIIKGDLVRSVRDYILYRQNVFSVSLINKKRKVIRAGYPQLQKWAKI